MNAPMLIAIRGSLAFLRVEVLFALGFFLLTLSSLFAFAFSFTSLGLLLTSSFFVVAIGLFLLYAISIYKSECFVVTYLTCVFVHRKPDEYWFAYDVVYWHVTPES